MKLADLEEYDEFKKTYKNPYYLCGKLGHYYNNNSETVNYVKCQSWTCNVCRRARQYNLYLEILKNVYSFDLQKHFIITFGGKEIREKISWYDSYRFMNKQWDKFLKTIKRKYGDLSYILLPRAQKDGYCHFHIITNKWLDWEWLNEKRKKYNLGFVSIQKNKDVAEYMKNDYWKKTEWYIPLDIKRYRTSRDIVLRNWKSSIIADYNPILVFPHNSKLSIKEREKLIAEKYNIILNYKSMLEEDYLSREFHISKPEHINYEITEKDIGKTTEQIKNEIWEKEIIKELENEKLYQNIAH